LSRVLDKSTLLILDPKKPKKHVNYCTVTVTVTLRIDRTV
jgi:hypothetical protein